MKIEIKTQHESLKGKKLIVPIDGEIEISEELTALVSEECAELLTTKTKDWKLMSEATDEFLNDDKKVVDKIDAEDFKTKKSDIKIALEGVKYSDLRSIAISLGINTTVGTKEFQKFNSQKKMHTLICKYLTPEMVETINEIINESE